MWDLLLSHVVLQLWFISAAKGQERDVTRLSKPCPQLRHCCSRMAALLRPWPPQGTGCSSPRQPGDTAPRACTLEAAPRYSPEKPYLKEGTVHRGGGQTSCAGARHGGGLIPARLGLNQQKARHSQLRSAPALQHQNSCSGTPAGPYLTTSFRKAVVK